MVVAARACRRSLGIMQRCCALTSDTQQTASSLSAVQTIRQRDSGSRGSREEIREHAASSILCAKRPAVASGRLALELGSVKTWTELKRRRSRRVRMHKRMERLTHE